MIFKTFLFLSLMCFCFSAFAKDYFYYQSSISNQCSFQKDQYCQEYASFASGNGRTVSVTSCYVQEGFLKLNTATVYTYVVSPGQTVTEYSTGSGIAGFSHVHQCSQGEQFVLNGCTATCIPDPCQAFKDQEFTTYSSCGSWSCPNNGTMQNGTCTNGKTNLLKSAPVGATVDKTNQCSGLLVGQVDLVNYKYETKDNGKSSGQAYCSAKYKYDGASSETNTEALTLLALSYYDAVPLPDNGVCPSDKPLPVNIGGIDACIDNKLPDDNPCSVAGEKPNANGVCVGPDDPTYPKDNDPTKPDPKTSCDAGEIRNNQGKCVPYADAGKCEAGEVRSNLGTCVPDPKANSCGQGLIKNKLTGSCDKDPRGTGCNDNSIPDKNGICGDGSASCVAGKKRDINGYCVPTSTPDKTGCKDGSTPNSQGICGDGSASCPAGKVRGQDGKCVLDTTESNSSGTASSDCDVAPDCGGDPLQCASLEQIWRTGCEQIKAMSEISQEDSDKMGAAATQSKSDYETAQQGIDTQAQGFFSDFETKASSVSSSAQCINDASLSVMGKSLIIPFSQACDFFRFLRIILLFSAYMLSARILFSGVS